MLKEEFSDLILTTKSIPKTHPHLLWISEHLFKRVVHTNKASTLAPAFVLHHWCSLLLLLNPGLTELRLELTDALVGGPETELELQHVRHAALPGPPCRELVSFPSVLRLLFSR